MSEVEFAVLTVLISVRVNDSAPSLRTHYRGGWVRGRERKMESVKSRTTEIQPAVFILSFFSFGLTLNPISLIPPSLYHFLLPFFFLSQITFAFFLHTFKSGLMLRGAELISSVARAEEASST